MRYFLLSLIMLQSFLIQAQNVGIGTAAPAARLHVTDSAVLFTGPAVVPVTTLFAPPASGAGTRFMWYPQKAALRAGYVSGINWDKDSIGLSSIALGYDAKARGDYSISLGYHTFAIGAYSISLGLATMASGSNSTSMGYLTTASGVNSTSMGYFCTARGDYSVSIGNNNNSNAPYSTSLGVGTTASNVVSTSMGSGTTASGSYSTSMGLGTIASASTSTTMGYYTIAKNGNSLVIGSYNDTTGIGTLFEVGNGTTSSTRSNAFTVNYNGNVGIGVNNPSNLLTFAPVIGKKISLYPGLTGDVGIGVYGNEFRQYSDNSNADITFGYDNYGTGFSEKVRFKATGMVGVGTASPVLSTGTSGMVVQNSTYIQFRVQSSASAAGLEFKPSIGNQYEIQADNSNNWFVYNRNVNAYRLFINGSGLVGIGTSNPTQALTVTGNILASGTITPSDIRLKEHIRPITDPIVKLQGLRGVYYEYKVAEHPELPLAKGSQAGVIAQDVEAVLPEAVITDPSGYKMVDYTKLVPLLIESLKAQQHQIDQQQKDIEALKKALLQQSKG